MIELFLKLIEKGIELLKEGERQRRLFFDEVVKPIQAVFEKMYEDHLRTFEKTRSMILDDESAPRHILSFVKERVLLEQGTTELLAQLTMRGDNAWMRTPRSLREHFDSYIGCIATCLYSPNSPRPSEPLPPAFYSSLNRVTSLLSSEYPRQMVREEGLKAVEGIVRDLQQFHAEVAKRYIEIQRYCSA